jgi:hypothetical protein
MLAQEVPYMDTIRGMWVRHMHPTKAVKVEMQLKSLEQKWNIILSIVLVNKLHGYFYNTVSTADIMQDWVRYNMLIDV